jgi:putative ABC transport system permease protein
MFKSYFRTAWRSLLRNKVNSTLNILGLAIGLWVPLMIGLWIHEQYSYDRWVPDYRQVCQVRINYSDNGTIRTQREVPLPLEKALKKDIPGVRYVASAWGPYSGTLSIGDKMIELGNLNVGDQFLNILQLPMLQGNRDECLKDAFSIVLTESTAKALFGKEDPMNKVVRIYGSTQLKVTGIVKDLPENFSLHFDYLTSFHALAYLDWTKAATIDWNTSLFQMYVGLRPNASYDQVADDSRMLVRKYAPASYKSSQQEVLLQPMKDWHLRGEFQNGRASGGLIDYLRLFGIIGVLVLLMASINFMNLSTARSEKRAREVGLRKVLGSSRNELILQFLIEAAIITCIAFLLSLVFTLLSLHPFNRLAGSSISIPFSNGYFWLIMLVYVLITALLAGSKPAWYLSSFQPAEVLKGTFQTAKSAAFGRKALIILQFTCSVALIISTITVYQQIQYARTRSTGYDANRLIDGEAGSGDYDALKNAALSSGVVSSMTKSLDQVIEERSHDLITGWEGKMPNESFTMAMNATRDTDYFKTLGIGFIDGSNFKGNPGADSMCAILNEAAVDRMRLKNPIGQFISWSQANAPARLRIIGVVKNTLTVAPFAPPQPKIFVFQPNWTVAYIYRLAPGVPTAVALEKLKSIFTKYEPSIPFTYRFVDEDYAAQFHLENLIGKLAGIFASLAVIICCLGLLGLVGYLAEQRTKEIGIRKVLGASFSQVLILLTGDFVGLVVISCVLASPIAFYCLHRWLQQYYYRIHIGPGVFVISTIVTILVALLTISWQAIRAALANPAKSLRAE